MKKILLSSFMFLSIAWMVKLNAQCTVSNLAIEVTDITPTGLNGCSITFNLSWQQEVNGGNKLAYVHLWVGSSYHTPASTWPTTPANSKIYASPSNYPTQTQLQNTILNFVIEGNNTANPTLGSTYYPDATVSVSTTGTVLKSAGSIAGTERIQISGIVLNFTDCSVPITLNGDIWATQASNNRNVHCVSEGLSVVLNDPTVTGNKNCNNPRTYNVTISTTSSTTVNVYYNLYKDDGDGIFEPGAGDLLIDTKTNINISSSLTYSQNNVTYPGNNDLGESNALWIEVKKTSGGTFSTVVLLENNCAPLPVDMKSFTASRSKSNVSVKWTTAAEWDNKGFYVQRNTRGSWENVAFVFSAAQDGNSSSDLSYSFNDLNNERGVSQYRILQVDIDGRSKASDIRSVRGEAMAAKLLVYPNPSMDGKISVVFEDGGNAARSVIVSDMSGRMIKQYRNVSTNNLSIEGLESGVYSIKVTDLSSAAVSVEKVIVKKR